MTFLSSSSKRHSLPYFVCMNSESKGNSSMGNSQAKYKGIQNDEKEVKHLREKVKYLEKEFAEIICTKEREDEADERERVVFAFKEAEWNKERKRLREEVRKLGKRLEEREERIRMMENGIVGDKSEDKEFLEKLGSSSMVEQMRKERAWREEAVEKWKRLYHEIKIELDDLIARTNQGEKLSSRAEKEDLMDDLQLELNTKQGTIELLQAKLVSMEKEASKRERELDILRQSLRIMFQKKKAESIANSLTQQL